VKRVTIVPREDDLGHMANEPSRAKIQPDVELTGKTMKWLEHELLIFLAAPAAESYFTGRKLSGPFHK